MLDKYGPWCLAYFYKIIMYAEGIRRFFMLQVCYLHSIVPAHQYPCGHVHNTGNQVVQKQGIQPRSTHEEGLIMNDLKQSGFDGPAVASRQGKLKTWGITQRGPAWAGHQKTAFYINVNGRFLLKRCYAYLYVPNTVSTQTHKSVAHHRKGQ